MDNKNEITVNDIIYVKKDSIKSNDKAPSLKGKPIVLVRSYSDGLTFGYLNKKLATLSGVEVELLKAKRIYKWTGACGIEQLALDGVTDKANTNVGVEVEEKTIMNVCSYIPMTKKAVENLNS